ncbi:glycosyltransferase family 4 protein [Sphingobacterium hungaricum]|uniref:Glycosyltransferase family 1 protein n=1 Tax=Sphingobacterium hungaricum TaxID=2082723 RepID=A0A928UYF3_9SPHI|nr:glycosyltransferase family 1 protein [Sphingobacterium hungaricum]MBE8713675.1 glycosyltransferase family 1 protein [Sphingobacterium hungaricum]
MLIHYKLTIKSFNPIRLSIEIYLYNCQSKLTGLRITYLLLFLLMSQIYFEAERLKYPNVGLYHFCLHLGAELNKIAQNDSSIDLKFYVPTGTSYFGQDANHVYVHDFHKFMHLFKNPPQIWHCTNQLSPYLPKSKEITKVLTIHDLNFLREGKSQSKINKYLKKIQDNIDASTHLVAISNFVKDEVKHYCQLNGKPIDVIYNGNNIDSETRPQKPYFENLDLEQPFLFSIGTFVRKKNFHVLPYLLVDNQLNLVISGLITDQSYLAEFNDIAEKLGVADRIFITGPIGEAEKYYLYSHCKIFCFPSLAEGFGLPVVEAMHFGSAILLSKETSLPEIGGDVASYFESFEPNYLIELGKGLAEMQLSASQVDQIKQRSKLFSWEHAAQSYWEIYKNYR